MGFTITTATTKLPVFTIDPALNTSFSTASMLSSRGALASQFRGGGRGARRKVGSEDLLPFLPPHLPTVSPLPHLLGYPPSHLTTDSPPPTPGVLPSLPPYHRLAPSPTCCATLPPSPTCCVTLPLPSHLLATLPPTSPLSRPLPWESGVADLLSLSLCPTSKRPYPRS